MAQRGRLISRLGLAPLIATLGALFVGLAVGRGALILLAGGSVAQALIDIVLIGAPGSGLVYGGYWLDRSQLHQEVQPRVAAWCLGGFAIMLGIVGLLLLDPSGQVDRPVRAAMIATALGSLAGLAIGINQARAHSRAREAEERQAELRRETDLREHIVETSPVGIMIIDAEGVVTRANRHAAEIFGLPSGELVGSGYEAVEFEVEDPEGNPVPGGLRRHILSTGEAILNAERQLVWNDGDRTWISISGTPLDDQHGDGAAALFAFEDITDRKRLEADLRETVTRLEQSNEQLRQFAYAASHDLQEPLRMVSTYLQLLENRYTDQVDADAREFIEIAVDGADRMREMVQDLLEFSRIERTDTAFEPVDCEAVIERVLADLEMTIEETDAAVVTEPLPTVEGDEHQLEQLFRNLVSNALKYSGDEAPMVEVAAERCDGDWKFSVADDGIGIDPAKTDQIFEVFKRLHHDDEYAGTGIGLSMCRSIVDRHGGDIWVDSEPGEGSTFYVTIPAAGEQGPGAEDHPEPLGNPGQGPPD